MPRSYTTPNGITLFHMQTIGSGAMGTAMTVRDKRTQTLYCLKEVPIQVTDDTAKKQALMEVDIMKSAKHPNVITFYESWFERNRLCILMEYAPNQSLDKLISQYSKSNMQPLHSEWDSLTIILRFIPC